MALRPPPTHGHHCFVPLRVVHGDMYTGAGHGAVAAAHLPHRGGLGPVLRHPRLRVVDGRLLCQQQQAAGHGAWPADDGRSPAGRRMRFIQHCLCRAAWVEVGHATDRNPWSAARPGGSCDHQGAAENRVVSTLPNQRGCGRGLREVSRGAVFALCSVCQDAFFLYLDGLFTHLVLSTELAWLHQRCICVLECAGCVAGWTFLRLHWQHHRTSLRDAHSLLRGSAWSCCLRAPDLLHASHLVLQDFADLLLPGSDAW
mmetsp:Transcript_32344/g.77367  ORF Transcript_32344/g.77367 Transcript_32344/m.77367 type:complete len:257 (-) Transcript_32344:442-1212(-)